MKNLSKIFISILLLFTTTNVVLGDNQGKNNSSGDITMVNNFTDWNEWKGFIKENFSVKGSVGVTDVYGSIHDLTPMNIGQTLGHSAIGLGFYKAPLMNLGKLTLCVDANVNYGSVAQKDFSRDTDVIYFVGGTLKFFPGRERNKANRNNIDCE